MAESAGADRRRRAQGRKADDLQQRLAQLDPAMARWADEFVFGELWGREGLAFEERTLVAVAALAATGQTDQLRNYLHGALQDGVPVQKLREALVMQCVYAGFPAAINALVVLDSVWRSHSAGEAPAPS